MADPANTSSGIDEVADAFTFESAASKEYPLAPEGMHNVIVAKATYSLRENTYKPGEKNHTINLLLQSRTEYTPVGETKPRPYNLFYRMKVSDHKKATMFSFFASVMGIDIPLIEVDAKKPDGTAEKVKRIHMERKKVQGKDGKEEIHFPQFENLQFSVIVKHEASEDGSKMYDNVDSIFATPEQKAENARMFLA